MFMFNNNNDHNNINIFFFDNYNSQNKQKIILPSTYNYNLQINKANNTKLLLIQIDNFHYI